MFVGAALAALFAAKAAPTITHYFQDILLPILCELNFGGHYKTLSYLCGMGVRMLIIKFPHVCVNVPAYNRGLPKLPALAHRCQT